MQFNDQQLKAINHQLGALLILAGPGSGKTATITARAAEMIKKGVDPANLLLVTFSKKAANEMRERIALLTEDIHAERASIHTFHALGDKIIKKYPEQCERAFGFTILDEADQRGLFVSVLKKMGVEKPSELNYRQWLTAYNRLAQDGVRAVESEHAESFGQGFTTMANITRQDQMDWLWKAFRFFEAIKRDQNVVDFNDLITLPMAAMRRSPQIGEELSKEFPVITIDEAQDTNKVQYEMLYEIGRCHGNITLVGDDDQIMYSWRGASTHNVQQFQDDFTPQIVRLEENYRSTSPIVNAASQHIQNNQQRMVKQPYSSKGGHELPEFSSFSGDREMSRAIVDDLKAAKERGLKWSDMAILYRKNRIGDMIEPALIEARIPYNIQGGAKLTERKEVKIAIAMARLVNNPRDQMAFKEVIKKVAGFGERGIEKHIENARKYNNGDLTIPTGDIKKVNVKESLAQLKEIVTRLKDEGPVGLIDSLVEDWGFQDYFPKEKEHQIETRAQRLRTFKAWIAEAVNESPDGENKWEAMQRVLLEDPESDLSAGDDALTLATAHRAKGQEWKHVSIAGYSDGLMPLRNKDEEIENEEEERRISYVAMTRAESTLKLYHADRMFLGYQVAEMAPSPYLSEFEHTDITREQAVEQFIEDSLMDWDDPPPVNGSAFTPSF